MIKQRWTKHPPTELRADRVLLYRTGTKLDYWQHGFQYLDKFDVVLVRDGRHENEAIRHCGIIAPLVPTLRVPMWRDDMLWMRRSKATEQVLAGWRAEPTQEGLLLALYQYKPLIWMLPDWREYEEVHKVHNGLDVYACREEDDWRVSVWHDGAQLWTGPQNGHVTGDAAIAAGIEWAERG